MEFKKKGCILFDWGDTLMRVLPEFDGPMKDWPRVEAVPGAFETLTALHEEWILALATNAADSDEQDIRAALRRVDLDRLLDKVYCFKKIGFRKPSPEFFAYILEDLGLPPDQVIMVGDDYAADVLGAWQCGLRAAWFKQGNWKDFDWGEVGIRSSVSNPKVPLKNRDRRGQGRNEYSLIKVEIAN
jgi:HAD superfamily hydrolase (TIGR01509 family)